MASKRTVFQRLAGLETEYAVRFHADAGSRQRPPVVRLFGNLVSQLRRFLPAAQARHIKRGVFLANGGALWHEAIFQTDGSGLIEGATPECREPRQLLAYQRAQDGLLADATSQCAYRFSLLKNNRDAVGNVYGGQENYEATLATGPRLLLWRLGMLGLLPVVAATWLMTLALMVVTIVLFIVLLILMGLASLAGPKRGRGSRVLARMSRWQSWEVAIFWLFQIICLPLMGCLWVMSSALAFRHARRKLLPFLLSRCILSGAGSLDEQGRFHLSEKAAGINCLIGFGGYFYDRPLFSFGHFYKGLFFDPLWRLQNYFDLFAARQRLQINLGDSNMCETAEYLRVATTMLVLDAIEGGAAVRTPPPRGALKALRRFSADPELQASVAMGGTQRTALQIQYEYLDLCADYVASLPDRNDQAREVLECWRAALDALPEHHQSLMGKLDWVTKQFLLEEAGDGATYAQRKKIDLRYHELTRDGYFHRLEQAGVVQPLLMPDEIERARRMPPPNSPAALRGHYIREFADSDTPIAVNWKHVYIGRGFRRKVRRLTSAGNTRTSSASDDFHVEEAGEQGSRGEGEEDI